MEVDAELHEKIGRIDANVAFLVASAADQGSRISTIEKRQYLGIGGAMIAAAYLLPVKYHDLMALFAL